MQVISTHIITCHLDMSLLEQIIVSHLGGENNRCSFFRSLSYIRLRLAALYNTNPTQEPVVAYCNQLSLSLSIQDNQKIITLLAADDFEPIKINSVFEPIKINSVNSSDKFNSSESLKAPQKCDDSFPTRFKRAMISLNV